MSVRIGIDVGGTFTDAVIIDNETYELIGTVKTPTTHDAPRGVATGIIMALNLVLKKYDLSPDDITFIAHGTTQATNSLLEGDVERVGIIGIGQGIEGIKVKMDTSINKIKLAPGRFLYTDHQYINMRHNYEDEVNSALKIYQDKGIKVVVVSGAYSVDDPTDENKIKEIVDKANIIPTSSHEVSKLYGLKVRTRTAVINASILPKMIQTADMTEESVVNSNIKAPLMVMRCDGGVMNVEEMKKRPILTMLSGPAAGVAGVLMHEKISEGIFLEVGGTSTDISAIHNGKVMVGYAEVGGHKTYVSSLDVRTVGIAGGSMIRVSESDIIDVGPRSAHIAGLPYLVYADIDEISDDLEVVFIQPKKGDFDDYIAIHDKKSGMKYALTLACAANASGFVSEEDYAKGNSRLAYKGFELLAKRIGKLVDEVLCSINEKAASKNKRVIQQLIFDYELDPKQIILIGGGGGAATVVPYLSKELGINHKIAKNAHVISPIGVALAIVRDVIERTIYNPTEEDILSIRREAEQAVLRAGAVRGTIEVAVEVDTKRNIVRATATGTSEFRTKDRITAKKTVEEIKKIAADSMHIIPEEIIIKAQTNTFYICSAKIRKKTFLGLFTGTTTPVRVIDSDGVIKLQTKNARVITTTVENCIFVLMTNINHLTEYDYGGKRIPKCYIIIGARVLDYSSFMDSGQITSFLRSEIQGIDKHKKAIIIVSSKRA